MIKLPPGLSVVVFLLTAAGALHAQPGTTLAKVKAAKALRCGVDFEEAEYSTQDAHGNHSAFDLDLCKAVAVATLGPGSKVIAVPYRDEEDALKGLRAGEVEVLATASANFLNATAPNLHLTSTVLDDDQAFLVNQSTGVHTSRDLAGKKICFLGGTEIEAQLTGYMQRQGLHWIPFPFQEEGEMEAALITGNCAAVTADRSQLAFERIAFRGMASHFEILPEMIAKDPLAVASRADDPQWAAILDWVVNALIQAEESGVTQANVVSMKRSDDPAMARLLGAQHGYGQYLGLDDAWAARMIEAVGNYGEMFERDLGAGSIMKLPRGENALSTQGGLMIARPMR